MVIYWITFLMTAFGAWALTSKMVKWRNKKYGKITYTRVGMAFLPMFLTALFRWNVGVDVVYGTGYYYREYMAIQTGRGNIFDYEIGFYYLMKLCNIMNLNLYLFYCVVTIVFFALFIKYIVDNTNNIVLSVCIFFISDLYLFTFSTLRQAIGIAFFLYPMSEMLNGNKYWKNWKCWLLAIIAVSMHTSIIYLILVLAISGIHLKKRTLLYGTIVGCVLSPVIRENLSRIMLHTHYFIKYFSSNEYQKEFTPTYFVIALLIFVPFYFYYDNFTKNNNNYILVNVAAFVVVLMLNSQILVMPYRIFPLFVPVYIVLITRLIESLPYRKSIKLVACVYFIIPFLFLFINQYYLSGSYELFKYKSIFEYMNQVW